MEKPPEYHAPSAGSHDDAPPAYDDALTEASISSQGSTHSTLEASVGGFPSRFNWYYHSTKWKGSTFHLGEHKKSPLFTLSLEAGWRGTSMSLHEGVGEGKKLIAEAFAKGSMSRHSMILLPSPQSQSGEEIREELHCHTNLKTITYTFSIRVPGRLGEKPVVEQFEWRQSHGSEVRTLDKHGWGYKLVRLQSSATSTTPEEGLTKSAGKKAVKQDGLTSDGKEVVAVWADNSEWSRHKLGKFQFLGSGASGELGDDWAIFAVMSGLRIWGILRLGATGGRSSGKSTCA